MISVLPGGDSAGDTLTISSMCGSPGVSGPAADASACTPSSPDGSARYAPISSAVAIHIVTVRARRLPRTRSAIDGHRARGCDELAERNRLDADAGEAFGEPARQRAAVLDLQHPARLLPGG